MTPKRYKLLKQLPDAFEGDEYFWNGQAYSNGTRTALTLQKEFVEQMAHWFEEVKESNNKKYRLKKQFEHPWGMMAEGLTKTAAEWHEMFPWAKKYPFLDWWMEEVSERIVVRQFGSIKLYADPRCTDMHYTFNTNQPIPEDKLQMVIEAIERVLNDSGEPVYTELRVRQLEQRAFEAARKTKNPFSSNVKDSPVFEDFKEYKKFNP